MRRILFGLAFALIACDGHDVVQPAAPPPPPPVAAPQSVAGLYDLKLVDGDSLPLLAFDLGAYQVRIVSGAIMLNADGTYSYVISHRIDDSGKVRTGIDADAGFWTTQGSAITMSSTVSTVVRSGTVSEGVLTVQSYGAVLVLRK